MQRRYFLPQWIKGEVFLTQFILVDKINMNVKAPSIFLDVKDSARSWSCCVIFIIVYLLGYESKQEGNFDPKNMF